MATQQEQKRDLENEKVLERALESTRKNRERIARAKAVDEKIAKTGGPTNHPLELFRG